MQEFYDYFNYVDGLTPEVYFKYVVFVSAFICICRLVGEIINSSK